MPHIHAPGNHGNDCKDCCNIHQGLIYSHLPHSWHKNVNNGPLPRSLCTAIFGAPMPHMHALHTPWHPVTVATIARIVATYIKDGFIAISPILGTKNVNNGPLPCSLCTAVFRCTSTTHTCTSHNLAPGNLGNDCKDCCNMHLGLIYSHLPYSCHKNVRKEHLPV